MELRSLTIPRDNHRETGFPPPIILDSRQIAESLVEVGIRAPVVPSPTWQLLIDQYPQTSFGVDDAVLFLTRLPAGIALYEVAEMIVFGMAMPALCEELQLDRSIPLFGWTALSHGSITHLLGELDDKGESHMHRVGVMNKGRVNHPLNSGNRPGCQVGSERNCLIDQSYAMFGTHHPLNIGRCCRNAAYFGMDFGLFQHLHQSSVR